MGNMRFPGFLLILYCLVALDFVIVAATVSEPVVKKHQKHAKSQLNRKQDSQKCDLVCPGQPPLSLPANFLQNCTSAPVKNPNPTQTNNSTTSNPSTTTVSTNNTESGEEASGENTTKQNETERIKKYKKSYKANTNHNNLKTKTGKLRQHLPGPKLKTRTVFLKKEEKHRLLKHHKQLSLRTRLDGCYVVCSDENNPDQGGESELGNEGSDESEPGDNYVKGEDSPIEIIYVPPLAGENKRPSDIYEINNIEIVQPQPAFEFNPPFIEDKRKKGKEKKRNRHSKNQATVS